MNHASMLDGLGRSEEALAEATRALEDARTLPGANEVLQAYALNSRARARKSLTDLAGARADYQAALELMERVYTGPAAAKAKVRYTLGDVLEMLGEHRAALACFEQAVEDMRALGLPDHPSARQFGQRRDALAKILADEP
jgi:tetratricopeptide (TPR) repeat protein